ncbi:MAG: squalene/phytoene synthase family protein [Defluviicoccus sp.]|nr:squalene/phytoene synthase family protein [Defluviicoccus sp.]
MLSDSRSYCAQEVRRLDRERYLAALFAPGRRRDALFALYAFNLEIAKTAEVVSEPLLGEIRLQWWRDAIDGLYDGSMREHPVLAALAEAIEAWDLERSRFHTILHGRAADLRERPFADLDALEEYVAETAVPLVELACQALGVEDEETMRLSREAGLGLGLAGVLRAIPFHARQRRLYVPLSPMTQAGIAPATLFDRSPPEAFAEAVRPVAVRARSHIAGLRRRRHDIPVAARAAFLPLSMSEAYLRRLARNGHDAFDPGLAFSPFAVQVRIGWAAIARRYSAASDTGPDQRSRSISARLQ